MGLPFDKTWWIVRNRIVGGRFPGGLTPEDNRDALQALVDFGFSCVVNLTEPGEIGRGYQPFPDYRSELQSLASQHGSSVRVLWLPIEDNGVPQVSEARSLIDQIEDEPLTYIHCWGGHGRTGTIGGCILRERGLPFDDVIQHMKIARDHDHHLRRNYAPQTFEQRTFIAEWPVQAPVSVK